MIRTAVWLALTALTAVSAVAHPGHMAAHPGHGHWESFLAMTATLIVVSALIAWRRKAT